MAGKGVLGIGFVWLAASPMGTPVFHPLRLTSCPSLMKSQRILLVEDHADTRNAMLQLLRHLGHVVEAAKSVRTALKAATDHPSIDLLICDIGLPDGDGWELMTTLRSQYGFPGIAVSGYGTPSDHERSLAAGYAIHLVKPLDPEELEAAIDHIVEGRGVWKAKRKVRMA